MTNGAPSDSRFYYQPMARAVMRGYAAFGFICALILGGAPHIPALARPLPIMFAFAYLFVFWRVGGRGLEARPDGIHFKRWLGWHFIPWREIKAFGITRPALSPTVYVNLVSGESRVVPFTQGRQTRWQDGKSRDTVAVLNTEIERMRGRAIPEP